MSEGTAKLKSLDDFRPDPEPQTLDVYDIDECFEPAAIPPRPWFIRGLSMRGHVTTILAPGGVGKSTFGLTLGVASALGKHHLVPGYSGVRAGNTLVLNTEDPEEEMSRRLAGVLEHHNIQPSQLKGKLALRSLYGQRCPLGRLESGRVVETIMVEALINTCKEREIEALVLDPLIGLHEAPENDNVLMEQVATILRHLADETGAAVIVLHHTRKTNGDTEAHAGDMDAGRGASALLGASRIGITLARMSKTTAKKEGIDWALARNLRRIDDAKMNYAQSAEAAKWFELRSTTIANGESVPVPIPFDMGAVAERKVAQTAAKDLSRLHDVMEEIAVCVIGDQLEGAERQPEVAAKLQVALKVGRSTALDRLRLIPISEHRAYKTTDDASIWREKTGQTYSIHWRSPK